MRIWARFLLGLVLAGCDRDPAAAPVPTRPPVLGVEVQNVTPLPPNHLTHFAPAGNGAIFWVQESETGRETMFVMSQGGVPVATPFTSMAVAQALGESGATGAIQSLAAGTDGKLYFYFSGGKGKHLLAALGCFTPEDGRTRIIADAPALMSQSEMGDSLALARGSVLVEENRLWLWLRHDDGYAVLSMDLRQTEAKPARAFARAQAKGEDVRMTSAAEDLAIGADQSLAYLDRPGKRIWKIGPLGAATQTADISDLPPGMTAPSLDARGQMVLFVPEEPLPDDFSLIPTTIPSKYPALVVFGGSGRTVLGRAAFTAPAKFTVRAMALNQLARDRGGWIAYDTPTGELLRLGLVER